MFTCIRKLLVVMSKSLYVFGISFITLFFTLAACEKHSDGHPSTFIHKKSQDLSERVVERSLSLKDSLLLSENYDIMSPTVLHMDADNFYIRDHSSLRKIIVIDNDTFEHIHTVEINEGRGPGEAPSLGIFDAKDGQLITAHSQLQKALIWNSEGDLLREFLFEGISPFRINIWNDSTFTVLAPGSMDTGNIFFTIDWNGRLLNKFGDVSGEKFNPIRFSGSTNIAGKYFYYAGFSEHTLAKWDQHGNLEFSVTTIDDFPDHINYVSFEDEEYRNYRYSPHAYYSAIGSAIYRDYWLILHGGDLRAEPENQLLDIYNKNNGAYLCSIKLPYRSGFITTDNNYLYALHTIDEESYLGIYDNVLHDLECN